MAGKSNSAIEYLPDGTMDVSGGVDSSLVTTLKTALNPGGLARSQLAWMFNSTVRGGGLLQRTGFQPLLKILASGRWQGGFMYEGDSVNPYLVCSISGVLYKVLVEPPYTVTDLTGGNPVLQNPAGAEVAWFCQGENYLVIQAGDYFTGPVSITINSYGTPLISPSTTLPLFWDGTILRRSRGITTVAPAGYLPGINEIPAATCMDYFAGRLWYAQARQYSAGDMVGGPSGTALNHRRDAILSVTENPLCLGGDGFTVPTNAGNIRALKHSANLNATLGEGNFYIFTRKVIYSLAVPVTRTDWIGADKNNQPLQTVVQMVNGAVGDRSVVAVNGDLFYQALEPSIRSLQVSVRNFGQWGNTPISQNEQRALQINDRGLMRFSSGIQFDNRLLNLCLPVLSADNVNVVHQAILPLDFDVVSNLSTQGPTNTAGTSAVTPPVWEGAYDGLQFVQLFEGDFGGLHRGFSVMISELDGSIGVWELTTSSRTENGDNRVLWGAEFPAFTWSTSGLETKLKQLKGAEIWIDKVSGTVDMDVYYREDADPCWRLWHHTSFCAARKCEEAEPATICYPPKEFREGYRFPIVLPEPKAACDSMGVRPTTIGYQFQAKLVIKGWCRVRGLILYALPHTEPQYHGIACASVPMAKIQPPPPIPIPPPPPPVLVPVNSAVPVITGTAEVGQTLSGSNGTWTNTPTSYSYQWLSDGTPIGGATANTFVLTGTQLGEVITFQVTASNAGGIGSPATSAATSAVIAAPPNPLATSWAARVVVNGGAAPSGGTVSAISDFCDALDAAGLTSKMIAVNCFAPDSLTAAITPLIVGPGNDPWYNHNNQFGSGDLSVDGLKGDGANKYLDTGILVPSAFSDDISAGITLYNTFPDNTAGKLDAGVQWGGTPFVEFSLYVNHSSGSSFFVCWDESAGLVTGALPANPFIGYVSGNRTAANAAAIYAASSVYPHASIGTIATTGSSRSTMTHTVLLFAQNTSSGPTPAATWSLKRFSFAAIHLGLTATDSLALYNAVQALRTALGGGFV